MAMNNPYGQYKQNSVMTASPEKLTLMLYDGALKFIKQGMLFIEKKNVEQAHYSIIRAQDIILEFISTLDHQYEVAGEFNRLYDYILYRLREANTTKDTGILEEVYGMVKELRDTWAEAMKLAKKG